MTDDNNIDADTDDDDVLMMWWCNSDVMFKFKSLSYRWSKWKTTHNLVGVQTVKVNSIQWWIWCLHFAQLKTLRNKIIYYWGYLLVALSVVVTFKLASKGCSSRSQIGS